jgi:hypothetical protein
LYALSFSCPNHAYPISQAATSMIAPAPAVMPNPIHPAFF